MAIQDITYIRSGMEFTGISDTKDIKDTKSITVSWDVKLKYTTDLTHLYLLRAILNPSEAADISKDSVTKKFRVVYKWERGVDSGDFVTQFTDKFKWDDNSDSNLHNLNINNDKSWNENKFNDVLNRIAAGEQGVYYKVYGYSRRMNRAATPLGFFCDGQNIVALSQRNQVINDKWYSECGQVWKSGQEKLDSSGECFCRVVVDMERDLGVNPKKCRRVWASTNKGRIVEFDYWTGEIINSISKTNNPIYAIGYCPQYRAFLYYDGKGNVKSVTENVDTHALTTVSLPVSDFGSGKNKAKRVMGGVCTWEGENDSNGNPICYFYVISNRETVIKIQIKKNSLSRKKVIPRTHFGCTEVHGDTSSPGYLGKTPANQNNIYGIGAGANGQVWTNGHTPITVLMQNVKSEGNPIRVFVSLGRGATAYNKNGTPKYPSWSNDGEYGGCYQYHNYLTESGNEKNNNPNDYWYVAPPSSVVEKWKDNNITGKMASSVYSKVFGDKSIPKANYDLVYELNKKTSYIANFGRGATHSPPAGVERIKNGWNKHVYDYSSQFNGERRPDTDDQYNWRIGCKAGFNQQVLTWLTTYISGRNRFGAKIDQRKLGKGTTITTESLGTAYKEVGGWPTNEPEVINAIHHELVAVFDGNIQNTNVTFLQDLNYVYGCTDNENINDSNGQIEDMQNFSSIDYRKSISASDAVATEYNKSREYFSPTTKWLVGGIANWSKKYSGMFGYAGEPIVFNTETEKYIFNDDTINSRDRMVRKPSTYSSRLLTGSNGGEQFKSIFKTGLFNAKKKTMINLADYKNSSDLPMSIGSVSPMVPFDGRMRVDRNNSVAYKAGGETNKLTYYISFADRREGKIGLLTYARASGSNADISYKEKDRRVNYIVPDDNSYKQPSDSREYFPYASTTYGSRSIHLDNSPYHVVADSDNNLWFTTPCAIGKLQLLSNAVNGGRNEKYVYNPENNTGLYAFENNNKSFESSLILLEKHASSGAKYNARFNPNGIQNNESTGSWSDMYKKGHELMQRKNLNLSKEDSRNKAYVYNYSEWYSSSETVWEHLSIFGKQDAGVWKKAYLKSTASTFYTHSDNDEALGGNLNNEFNSDNFGLNCLMQMNRVEVGPDMIHPMPLLPTASTRISRSVSTSHNDRCDKLDDRLFWDEKTSIFDNEQSTSGYDDLDTTHQIYNIVPNGRKLMYHRYVYHDSHIVGPNQKRHPFELDTNGDVEYPDRIYDNSPELVWRVPNYIGLIPRYNPLSQLSGDSNHCSEHYTVDIYLDCNPSVYDLWSYGTGNSYESVLVGTHHAHVFERWPTPDFCVRGIGNSESVDKITNQDIVGLGYWGDC